MAEKHGVRLVYKQPFSDFFHQHVQNREHKNLLGRMQALEVGVWFLTSTKPCISTLSP